MQSLNPGLWAGQNYNEYVLMWPPFLFSASINIHFVLDAEENIWSLPNANKTWNTYDIISTYRRQV